MSRITSDPAVLSGKPIIAGTRISVEMILDYLSSGLSIDEILDEYPQITRADVLACLDFVKKYYAAPKQKTFA